jgi:hypothetical protein
VGSVSDEPNRALHPTRRLVGFVRLTALLCRPVVLRPGG